MVKSNRINLKKVSLVGLAFFFFLCSYAQQKTFPVFKDYRSWGVYLSPKVYRKGSVNPYYGNYSIEQNSSTRFGFGISKLFRSEREISFKAGVHFEIVPAYNFNTDIEAYDIYEQFNGSKESYSFSRYLFHFPFLVQLKKQMSERSFFNVEFGPQIVLMQPGEVDVSYTFWNEDQSEARQVFALYSENPQDSSWIYPNLLLGMGFYFTFNDFLLQTNIEYQKTLVNYWEGEYVFDNMLVSGRSMGSHKLSGDYLGLSVTVHLKNKKKKYKG